MAHCDKDETKGLKIFAPVMVSGNRGIDYMIYMLSRDWQITKKQRLLDYMYFGVYRQTDGFHLVGFMYLDSNPLAKPEKAFFTPHFFDRYKERTGLPMDMESGDFNPHYRFCGFELRCTVDPSVHFVCHC